MLGAMLFGSAAIGCSPPRDDGFMRAFAQEAIPACAPDDTTFFPPKTFASGSYDGLPHRRQMAGFFRLMSEPSLWCGEAPDEGYRFLTYFPFWGPPNPVSVRIARRGSRVELVAVILAGGREPGVDLSVRRRIEKRLQDRDWRTFAAAVDNAGFWAAPANTHSTLVVFDPPAWVLEGRRGHLYRALPFAPIARPLFRAMAKTLFTAAGVPVPEEVSD
jgi:hypothetical protein